MLGLPGLPRRVTGVHEQHPLLRCATRLGCWLNGGAVASGGERKPTIDGRAEMDTLRRRCEMAGRHCAWPCAGKWTPGGAAKGSEAAPPRTIAVREWLDRPARLPFLSRPTQMPVLLLHCLSVAII